MSAHTQTKYEDGLGNTGPDYCAECSAAAQEWVGWPCPEVQKLTSAEQRATEGSPVIHAQTPYTVLADASERLAQLHASYADAKATADEANARLKTVTDGIKAEMAAAAPEGQTRIALAGENGPALQLTYSESWRVDSKKLKREDPETYVRYAAKSGSWTLRAVAGGESE